jgi:3-dehydroquinate synthase II
VGLIYYLDLRTAKGDVTKFIDQLPISGVVVDEKTKKDVPIPADLKQIEIDEQDILDQGTKIGEVLSISSSEEMQDAMQETMSEEFRVLLIETADWQIIPLENLIAKYNNTEIQLLARARSPQEVKLLEDVLEIGVGGCVLSFENIEDYDTLELTRVRQSYELSSLEVHNIERIGIGDRVCVDT